MSDEANSGADVALELAGQKVNIKNVKSLNTGVTLLTCGLVMLICYGGYLHTQQATKQSEVLHDTFKEMTQAQREQNCLIAIPEAQREHKADFCKRITR